ncbi:hypothetical protein AX17_000145 [Amanita inopinata Kibby_2008]|nr:hypothetical protein AX17_000145 [Amanita inopinata Kibby_2008]
MSSRRQSPTPRRVLAIKRADGEPLTRVDIQYDLLSTVFNDGTSAFTNPWKNCKLTCFRELYVDAILNSPKATRALKDRMLGSSQFATSFAMLSLLVNVGRINTTMSFFPEMKTAIRTYHPIPALQRTEGNLQDAPRIKHILKASLLTEDGSTPPTTPQDIMARLSDGKKPPTSITNLLFVLGNYSIVAQKYFKPTEEFSLQLDFLDLFLRAEVSSASRGRAFLWICWLFLEQSDEAGGAANPFSGRGRAGPEFELLSKEESALENVDPEEEKAIAERLMTSRSQIIRSKSIKEAQRDAIRSGDDFPQDLTSRSRATLAAKERKAVTDKMRRERLKDRAPREHPQDDQSEGEYASDTADVAIEAWTGHRRQTHHQSQLIHQRNASPAAESSLPHSHQYRRYSPYKSSHGSVGTSTHVPSQLQGLHHALPPSMTMLQRAWHVVITTDPLVDSDDELGDDHARMDYSTKTLFLGIPRF